MKIQIILSLLLICSAPLYAGSSSPGKGVRKITAGTGVSVAPSSGRGNITLSVSGSGLPAGATSYIHNSNTLQSGATFFVSSGTVANLNTTTLITIDSTGIGTATPTSKLDVSGGSVTVRGAGAGLILNPDSGTTTTFSIANGSATITNGDYISTTAGLGMVVKDASNGNCYRVRVSGGTLGVVQVTCP